MLLKKLARIAGRSCGARLEDNLLVNFLFYSAVILSIFSYYDKLRHMHKQEMELSTCAPSSCYMYHLLTDLQRVRMSVFN